MSAEDEMLAKIVMKAADGVEVDDYDDGSLPSMVDFMLRRAGEPVGCAEVSRLTSREGLRGEQILQREGIEDPDLRHVWDVGVNTREIKRGVAAKVAVVLASLEAMGASSLDALLDDEEERRHLAAARVELAGLGVSHCRVIGSSRGLVICTSAGFSMSRGAADVLDDLRDFMWFDAVDVPSKLLAHDGPERHAFIWVDWHAWGSWRALDGLDLPSEAPAVPAGLTHVWVASWESWRDPEQVRGWRWDGAEGWREFSVTRPVP